MAPCFFSCEGRGTSRRTPPVTGRRDPSFVTGSTDVADFGVVVEIVAVGASRMSEVGNVVDAVAKLERVKEPVVEYTAHRPRGE